MTTPPAARGFDASNPRAGVEDDGNLAWPERREQARRLWTEADAADFEAVDHKGRIWRDLGSGIAYRALSGAPLLSVGEPTRAVSCFFVLGDNPGRLVVLRRADYQEELRGPVQHVHARRVAGLPLVEGPGIL